MRRTLWVCSMVLVGSLCALGQESTTQGTSAKAVVPSVVSFSGTLLEENGQPLTTITGVTFFLYEDQQGGAPLWMETQNVRPDKNGHYSVMLGAMTRGGLQSDLFASGEARWLGVQAQGHREQARIMLLAVPYALKAADAETVGGLPASAFVLAAPAASGAVNPAVAAFSSSIPGAKSAVQAGSVAVTTSGSATVGTIPFFSTATDIEKSIITQTGTTGINVLGKLNFPATGTATATAGKASRAEAFTASAFNSGTAAAVAQNFQLQAEPANNNTASPSGTLNLLYSAGTAAPAETGFRISSNGTLTFVPGQVFSGIGSGLTGVNATQLGGVSPTGFAKLASANTFTKAQTIKAGGSGNLLSLQGTGTGGGTFSVDAFGNISNSGIIVSGNDINTSGFLFSNGLGVTGPSTLTNNLSVTAAASNGGCCTAINATGGPSANASGVHGSPGIASNGGNGDPNNITSGGDGVIGTGGDSGPLFVLGQSFGVGGSGVSGFGGNGTGPQGGGGAGGSFIGGNSTCTDVNCPGPGIIAEAGQNANGVRNSPAGVFQGDILVLGAVFATTKDFKIDHPLDPANKYLVHASVESSEMMNIYTGNVTTDADGVARVRFPEWFEALNTDFRYQLTVIGQFAQAVVAHEIENHEFMIRTNTPNVKVSWQVTGVRHDAFAKAHPLLLEEEKTARHKGFYLHPELYGAPAEKQIGWGRPPNLTGQVNGRNGQMAGPPLSKINDNNLKKLSK